MTQACLFVLLANRATLRTWWSLSDSRLQPAPITCVGGRQLCLHATCVIMSTKKKNSTQVTLIHAYIHKVVMDSGKVKLFLHIKKSTKQARIWSGKCTFCTQLILRKGFFFGGGGGLSTNTCLIDASNDKYTCTGITLEYGIFNYTFCLCLSYWKKWQIGLISHNMCYNIAPLFCPSFRELFKGLLQCLNGTLQGFFIQLPPVTSVLTTNNNYISKYFYVFEKHDTGDPCKHMFNQTNLKLQPPITRFPRIRMSWEWVTKAVFMRFSSTFDVHTWNTGSENHYIVQHITTNSCLWKNSPITEWITSTSPCTSSSLTEEFIKSWYKTT